MASGGPGPGGGGPSSGAQQPPLGPGYHHPYYHGHHHHNMPVHPTHHNHHQHDALYRPAPQRQHDDRARHFAPSPSTAPSSVPDFTPEMRDRQARGKDPEGSGPGPFAFGRAAQSRTSLGFMRAEPEPFEKAQRREKAAAILDNPELLMVYAQRTGDSIPATRMRFMRIMCGYDDDGDGDHRDSHTRAPEPWSPNRGGSGSGLHNSAGR